MAEEIPELTEEFVKERGRYETVEEYRAATRAALEENAASRQRNDRIDAAMKAISDASECDIAQKIIDAEVERMYAEFAHQMSHYGIAPEDYLKYNNSSPEQFRAERKEPAARNIKMRRVMRAVIEAENIEVSEQELTSKLRDPSVRAELERVASHNGGRVEDYAYNDLIMDKFFDFLLENNEFVLEQPAEPDGAEKEQKPAEKSAAKKPAAKKPAAKKSAAKPADKPDAE